ncbi:MAG: shikimate kinase [Acidobacteriaceae bacterium]|nr:shikimate kinase [Acidobacteriaceae bacterium]
MILKLKRTPGLYLVGFMASGKTTVGRALADELGWPFADIDHDIEGKEGTTISRIFETQGEEAFRALEAEAIRRRVKRIEAGHPCVVALGGGAFAQPQNWQLIQNNGVTVWLDCTIERVHQRLNDDGTRPLAANREQVAELFEARRPLYARADFRIEVDCDDEFEIARKILELPIF